MKGFSTMEMVFNGLQAVEFPNLTRPPVKPGEPPTEELVQWGIKLYTFSVTAQVRKILEGLVQLAKAENIPASYVLGRHIFEWAAHACYMSRNLKNYVQRKEWGRAWSLLTIAVVGNLWMKQHGTKYASPTSQTPPPVPDPLTVANVIAAYEQYLFQTHGSKTVKENYGLLSELSHPNAACLQQHHVHHQGGRETEIADAEPISPLPFVNWCLLDLLGFIDTLLALAQETVVSSKVSEVLSEIAKRAPAMRT
jgi:hypothetical protein